MDNIYNTFVAAIFSTIVGHFPRKFQQYDFIKAQWQNHMPRDRQQMISVRPAIRRFRDTMYVDFLHKQKHEADKMEKLIKKQERILPILTLVLTYY